MKSQKYVHIAQIAVGLGLLLLIWNIPSEWTKVVIFLLGVGIGMSIGYLAMLWAIRK